MRYFCEHDGTLSQCGDQATVTSASTTGQSLQSAPKTPRIGGRLKASTQHSTASSDTSGISSTEHQQRLSGISDHLLKSPHPGQNDNDGQLTMSPTRQMLRRAEGGKKFLPQSISASIHGTSMHEKPVLSQSAHPSLSKTPVPTSKESLSQSLHRIASSAHQPGRPHVSPVMKSPSRKFSRRSKFASNDEVSTTSFDATSVHSRGNGQAVPYFEKLCWVCEELDYPYEYADIVGSQFLGLDGASPVTHVDGHVPTMEELVEFLAFAFICLTDHADMTVVLLDDFQWVDAFSWRVFQLLCKKGKKLLVICATRSHDKQALRRLSNAASGQSQLQSRLIEISLGPLDYAEIRQLTARVLVQKEEAISDGLCTDIFQRTGGLPVYVVQTLENIKRKKSVELDENGMLQWTAEGLKEKRALMSNKTGVVMEETFLSRFDTLDARVRKVLQTCAVLGLSFALSDVVQVHPEIDEIDIENALEAAIDEMILVEQVEDEDDNMSLKSSSTGTGGDSFAADTMRSSEAGKTLTTDRFFQFSHAMWRQNVLTTMLKERKIELHRLIAESMEQDQVMILEQSDISRLLTLFEHWKSCGDFCKTSQLALAVGARLEEWDLCAQSLELYQDALEMSFDTVERVDQEGDSAEWIQVAAKPSILDYILRLHIRIGLCHQNLGEEMESIAMFEDAYNIIKSSSKIPGMSKALMMPIISSLCVLKLDRIANDNRTKLEQEKLAEKFVKEAINNGNPVHIGRAVAMEAQHYARTGDLERAFAGLERLASIYDIEANSFDMLAEYGRDFALECYCESVQWYYLSDQSDKAAQQADMVVKKYLPLLSSVEADIAMYAVLPLFQVYLLLGRVRDADALLKQYVINPYRDSGSLATFWAPLFNPLAYLVEVVIADEEEQEMSPLLMEIEAWVLNEENDDFYEEDLERYAHTVMGEICWRLMNFKEDDDPSREALSKKARDFLTPIACYPHVDSFLKQTAKALLEAL